VERVIAVELPPDARAPGLARNALAGLDGQLGDAFGDVLLLVSELVTNGVRHAGQPEGEPLRVAVDLGQDRVRVEVTDQGPGFDHGPLPPDPQRAGGWGLRLVQDLALDWGVLRDGGTTVWFELERVF